MKITISSILFLSFFVVSLFGFKIKENQKSLLLEIKEQISEQVGQFGNEFPSYQNLKRSLQQEAESGNDYSSDSETDITQSQTEETQHEGDGSDDLSAENDAEDESSQTTNSTNTTTNQSQQSYHNDYNLATDYSSQRTEKWYNHRRYNRQGQSTDSGTIVRCAVGCKNCSNLANGTNTTLCETCTDGFYLDSSTNVCFKCPDLCVTCSSINSQNCTSCYPGWTLTLTQESSLYTCLKCSETHCAECSTQSACSKCKNSFFLFENSTCQNCTSNCRSCGNSTSCTQCHNGYFINILTDSSSECKICSDGCASCTKLTDCQECYPGFFMNTVTKSCEKCSENCWNCTSSTNCSRCVIGTYLVGSSCVDAIDNCAVMNSNNTCSKCYYGYTAETNRTSCVASTDSKNSTSTTCRMHHYRKGQSCQSCNSTILNCNQCNSTICLRCVKGYLPASDGTSCIPCSNTLVGCIECENSIYCTECGSGYYMEQDVDSSDIVTSYGQCLKCNENCLTCNQQAAYCTSCQSGFNLSTARTCVPPNQFEFTLLLNLDLNDFVGKIDTFKAELAAMVKDDSVSSDVKQKFVQITKISTGSVKVEGTFSATSTAAISSTQQSFQTSVSTGSSFSGIEVLSSEFSTIKFNNSTTPDSTTNQTEESQSSSSSQCTQNCESKIGIIVGIAVGVCVLIAVAVTVYCLCFKKKKQQDDQNEKRTTSTGDDFPVEYETVRSSQKMEVNDPSPAYYQQPTNPQQKRSTVKDVEI